MGTEHVVLYRDQDTGEQFKLDINSGRRFDGAGNELPHTWRPADREDSGMLADYVDARDAEVRAVSLSTALGGKQRPAAMRSDASGRLVRMDLGHADVHIPAALPNFASGYTNEPPMADMYAPPLRVPHVSDKFYQYAKEDAFQAVSPIAAAPAAGVPEIAPRLTNDSFTTTERALGGFVATEIEANADAALKIRQATADRVLTGLHIGRELRTALLAETAGTWDSSVVTTLTAGFQWNGGASADPVKDIHAAMEASWGAATGMILSLPGYHALVRSPAVRGYYAYKDSTAPVPTPQQLSALLDLPAIYVAKMQYINSSGNKAYIWGNHAVLVRQPAEMPPSSQKDVASAYTFRWNGATARDGVASAGGFIVREFFIQDRGPLGGNKVVIVHFDAEKQTSKFAGALILNVIQ